MQATIVIPTRNRWDTLARTLPSVLAQDRPRSDFEVVVVDDGSEDGPCEVVAEASRQGLVTLLRQKRGGPAAARNHGLAIARGEVIVFLDDDIVCPPGLLSRHLEAHCQGGDLVSYGPIFLAPGTPMTLIAERTGVWYRDYWRRIGEQGGLRIPADTLFASNSAISRPVLRAIGGFDEAVPSKEDTELGIRLWKRGVRMRFLPQAVAHELFVKSSREYVLGDGERWGRSEVYICKRHPEFRRHSGLASLGSASLATRFARRFLVALPEIFHSWIVPLYRWVELSPARGSVRRGAMAALALHNRLLFLRGACRQSGGWRTLRTTFGSRLPILLYHHVGPRTAGVPPELTMLPANFERQVRWLAKLGYRGIRASEWASWCQEGRPLPSRSVAITFDDAYADIAIHALPVLESYGFGATIFVVTREIGGSNSWDEPRGFANLRLMSAAEMKKWAIRDFEFGSHSRTHRDLTKLDHAARLEELAGSSLELEKALGRRAACFAYPYGIHDNETHAAVAGTFESAVTCDEGMNFLDTDLCLLRRTMVQSDDSFLNFAGRVMFGWSPTNRLRTKLAVRRRFKAVLRSMCEGGA